MKPCIQKIKLAAFFLLLMNFPAIGQDIYPDLSQMNTTNSRNLISQSDINRSRNILEISHGQAFVDWKDAWAWMFYCNYLYMLRKNIAVGVGLGLQFDWTGRYPVVSTNIILGNKSESFAAGIDLKYMFTELIATGSRLWVTPGCYYKNFFIKTLPTFLFGYPREWYLEAGYSFTIKTKK